jgi:purine-binding chemotaxis protein CheW
MTDDNGTVHNMKSLDQLQGKYLTFELDRQEYGLEILKVKEIIGMMGITAIPQTPDYVKGVINLRGRVIPVIELRARFGMPAKEYDDRTCIIVVEIQSGDARIQMGIIVDSVSEVLNVTRDDLEPTPRFGVTINTDFILGMAKGKTTVRTLLNIDNVLTSNELKNIVATTKR